MSALKALGLRERQANGGERHAVGCRGRSVAVTCLQGGGRCDVEARRARHYLPIICDSRCAACRAGVRGRIGALVRCAGVACAGLRHYVHPVYCFEPLVDMDVDTTLLRAEAGHFCSN